MGNIGTILAQAGALTLVYAERLLVGIRPEQFARLARPGGVEIKSNHPAWAYGHLALYPQKVLTLCGKPAAVATPPSKFDELFKNGVDCQDDATGTLYPSMEQITSFFFSASRAALEAVRSTPDETLLAPNPAEGRMKELFPHVGGALNFYLSGHAQQHLGQVSAWRRACGMPPA